MGQSLDGLITSIGSNSQLLGPLRQAVLSLGLETDPATVVYVYHSVRSAQEKLRAISGLLQEQLLLWLSEHGDLVIDDQTRLYVGVKKTTRCRDIGQCLTALEEAASGEVEKVVECLSANAIKPGAARSLLGQHWPKHFVEVVETNVETGKPVRVVKETSNRYVPRTVVTTKTTGTLELRYVPRPCPPPDNQETTHE